MKSFTPKYSTGTYLYYPLAIGVSFWISKEAVGSYQSGIINLYTTVFIIVVGVVLLFWLYLFTKNKFSAIDFYDGELVFTNVLGIMTRVKKEEIKSITSLGIRTKTQIMPISFYFMNNNSELYFWIEGWRKK
ncbi:hypothetical protein [Sabulibacter ruber]|uniref:hypothetical protein n=1 Tax=Sabulibacter ruber TaxID=2811901 RepID=UPI001A958BAD|nr:hypothetical protein [Sabulibacter ruber]